MSVLKIKNSQGKWEDIKTIIGPRGKEGAPGPAGRGVPAGGTAGQVLIKNSDQEADTVWGTPEWAKPWKGSYTTYLLNKEYIDANFDIIVTDDTLPMISQTAPTPIPIGLRELEAPTSDEALNVLIVQTDEGSTIEILNASLYTLKIKGYRIYTCDKYGGDLSEYLSVDTEGTIDSGTNATFLHTEKILSDTASKYIIVGCITEVIE